MGEFVASGKFTLLSVAIPHAIITSAEIADDINRNNQRSEFSGNHGLMSTMSHAIEAWSSRRKKAFDPMVEGIPPFVWNTTMAKKRGPQPPLFDQPGFQDPVFSLEPFANTNSLFYTGRVIV